MRSVLIIEDDADMRELERTILEHHGFTVVTAHNGRDGLRLLDGWRPTVILLDLMMPIMDGLAFLRERHAHANAARVPVVCVSAAGPQMMADAHQLGACECLPKPVDLDALAELIEHYSGSGSAGAGH